MTGSDGILNACVGPAFDGLAVTDAGYVPAFVPVPDGGVDRSVTLEQRDPWVFPFDPSEPISNARIVGGPLRVPCEIDANAVACPGIDLPASVYLGCGADGIERVRVEEDGQLVSCRPSPASLRAAWTGRLVLPDGRPAVGWTGARFTATSDADGVLRTELPATGAVVTFVSPDGSLAATHVFPQLPWPEVVHLRVRPICAGPPLLDELGSGLVQFVEPGPAYRAGLRAGDRIIAVDGASSPPLDSFDYRLAASPGEVVSVDVVGWDGVLRPLRWGCTP